MSPGTDWDPALDSPATAREAISAAGLDYDVALADLITSGGTPVPGRKAVIRTDSSDVLGIVGNTYVPIQNSECFSFLDAVVAEGGLRYHTAGALRKGERIWLLAKLPGQIRVRFSEDVSEKYLLLSNSHDGSSALRVHYTAIRVVCANTLAMADRQGHGEGITIRHQGNLASKVREAQEVLGLAVRFFDDLAGQFDLMARHYPNYAQVSGYFKSLYPDPEEGNPSRAQNVRDELFRLFEGGRGQDIPEIKSTDVGRVQRRHRIRGPPSSHPGQVGSRPRVKPPRIRLVRLGLPPEAARLPIGPRDGRQQLTPIADPRWAPDRSPRDQSVTSPSGVLRLSRRPAATHHPLNRTNLMLKANVGLSRKLARTSIRPVSP